MADRLGRPPGLPFEQTQLEHHVVVLRLLGRHAVEPAPRVVEAAFPDIEPGEIERR